MRKKIFSYALLLFSSLLLSSAFNSKLVHASELEGNTVKTPISDSELIPVVDKDDNSISPKSGGYMSSTYSIVDTYSDYTSTQVLAIPNETYTPVGNPQNITQTVSGTISLNLSGTADLQKWLKGSLGLTLSKSYSYTSGSNITIVKNGSYTHGRVAVMGKFRNRAVTIKEVQKFYEVGVGYTYKTYQYDATIKEPVDTYYTIQYKNF